MKRPKFHDTMLSASLANNAPWIEAAPEELDKLSSDIAALELYLREAGVRITVTAQVGARVALRWTEYAPKQWRVVHVAEDGTVRPLIETPAAVRMVARDYLPRLLTEIGRAVQGTLS